MELDELFHGKEYAVANKNLHTDIQSLDGKYPGILTEGDSFGKHIVMTTNIVGPNTVTFYVDDEENEIPQKIKDEMTALFYKHFPGKNPDSK